jgi:RNA polymerase sigma-70 factor (ECF subfamily)
MSQAALTLTVLAGVPSAPGSPGETSERRPRLSTSAQLWSIQSTTVAEVTPGNPPRVSDADSDETLVERARAGSGAAFQKLVLRHQERAHTVALGLLRDEQDAREIVQEAFLRVFRRLDSFQGGSTFFTWLYRIVRNLCIDLLRKPARRGADSVFPQDIDELIERPLTFGNAEGDPLQSLARGEIVRSVEQSLARLPSYHRQVIVMRELEGLSYEEMAERIGVSKGTVMSRLFHARRKLQRSLGDCYREHLAAE